MGKEICTSQQKPKFNKINNDNVSAHENHAHFVIGPRNNGKKLFTC